MIYFNIRAYNWAESVATTLERVHPVKIYNNITIYIYLYRLGGAQTSCRIGQVYYICIYNIYTYNTYMVHIGIGIIVYISCAAAAAAVVEMSIYNLYIYIYVCI